MHFLSPGFRLSPSNVNRGTEVLHFEPTVQCDVRQAATTTAGENPPVTRRQQAHSNLRRVYG